MTYKISIIIPTYNAKNYLMTAVDSVINQSFGFNNIELIIVDDNSSDGTKEILKELSNKYGNIVPIFLKENTGSPSKPRNIGIQNASSEYIMFLDNDDYYCPNFCETMYNTIIKYNADVISCRNYDYINGEFRKFHSILDKKDKIIKINSIEEDTSLLTVTSMLIWNKIYKRKFLLKHDITVPIGTSYEDVYFNLNVYINAHSIVFLNDFYGYVYNIRLDENNKSTSQDFKESNLNKFYRGLKNIFNLLDKENKKFDSFEAEMLVGFSKWLIMTPSNTKNKLIMFNDFKPHYKQFNIFTRLNHISLINNIIANILIKFISLNDNCLKIVLKLYNILS